jgi:hypothetical protein
MSTVFRDGVSSLRNLSADDMLAVMGLEKRRNTADIIVPTVAIFAAGALVGAAAAILFAPKPGAQLRRELSDGARDLTNKLSNTVGNATQVAQDYVGLNRNHGTSATAT